jgi:predicted permease
VAASSAVEAQAILSDLDEEFAERVRSVGRHAARRWYVSQIARSIPPLARRRLDLAMSHARSTLRISARPQLTQAIRGLLRAPGFSAVTVFTLALGIGASTASFTAISAAVLQPLPYPTSSRLGVMEQTRGTSEISVSFPDYLDWRTRAQSFDAIALFRGFTGTLTGGGIAERIRGQVVTSSLSAVLGTAPMLGRFFAVGDDRAGATATVILGEGLWRRRFGADGAIVGTTIQLDGAPYLVIGVMPAGFRFPDGIVYAAPDVYLSLGSVVDADLMTRGSHTGFEAIGLLRDGVSLTRARDEMTRLQRQLADEHADADRGVGVRVDSAVSVLIGDLGNELKTVWSASLLLVLIACANVAGLTLTRSMARRREMSVRTALGGTRASLAVTLVLEQCIVAAVGTAAGVLLAYGLTRVAGRMVADLPRLATLRPDARTLAFAAGLTALTSIVCSLAPVVWISRTPLDPWLRSRGQTHGGWRLRRALVGVQVTLAVTLVACAGLLGISLDRLQHRSGGIVPAGALTFDLRLPDRSYPKATLAPFYQDLYARLTAAPGVEAIGGISTLPFSGSGAQSGVSRRDQTPADAVRADVAVVTTGYFRAMGVALTRGRLFESHDGLVAPGTSVAIVDDRLANRFWPGESGLGEHLRGWGFDDLTVVGIVGHVDNYGVGSESREELYVPMAARPASRLFTVVRSTGDAGALAGFVRHTVSEMDATLAVANVQTMDAVVGRTVAGPRLAARLSQGFGVLAMLLAGIGIYGLVAYAVELRRREAGLRLALGAAPASVVRLMAMEVAGPVGAGAVAGIGGAAAAGAVLRHQLFDIGPHDPVVLIGAAGALVVTAGLALWLPARRIARVSPAITLQAE